MLREQCNRGSIQPRPRTEEGARQRAKSGFDVSLERIFLWKVEAKYVETGS